MAEDIQKRCPKCTDEGRGPDVPMVERQNKANGGFFIGCSNWPTYQHTEPVPESVRMRRMGAETLPGFD